MSVEENITIAHRLCAAFNAGDIDALDQLIAPECIDHTAEPGQATGLAGLKQAWAQLHYTFPNLRLTGNDLTVQANQVAIRASFQGPSSTGKQEQAMLVEAFRISGGKVVELWNLIRWN